LNWAAGSLAPPKPLSPVEFALRLGCALLCGAVIGVERQWRQRTAGLRTYTLVAVGSALFVMLATLTPGDSSPTRIAGQIVTGIGFLGAGVIMRSGLNVRGLKLGEKRGGLELATAARRQKRVALYFDLRPLL